MATQSGLFTFDGGATLRHAHDDAWSAAGGGVRRHPSGLAMTLDGRIDNREELRLRLGSGIVATAEADDDAGVLLAMVERWGTDVFAAIVGEWSAVVWDGSRRTLHLARDYMGTRPLYYCTSADAVAWSTDLQDVVERTGRFDELTDRFAAQFMTLSPRPETTPYEGVHAVPPGACLTFTATGSATIAQFWHIADGEIRYRDPRAYEEQLRSLWRDAVLARLRTQQPIWAELSGGLDSSSVVCMADLLIKRGVAPIRAFRLVSHATLHSPEGDERRFIAEVERQVGGNSEIVGVEDSQDLKNPLRGWLTPYALHGVGLEMLRRVQSADGRIVLSGRIGDAVMGCQPDNSVAIWDDLARVRILRALHGLRAWSRSTRAPAIALACRLLTGDRSPGASPAFDLLTPRLREIAESIVPIEVPRGIRRSKQPLARMILGYSASARLDVPDRPPEIVYAYPFTHRPLVDFMLAIPGEQLSAPGTTRALMRRAFAPFVPARIIRRVSKGYYPPAAYRAARRLVTSIRVPALEVVERGWIDSARLQAAIRALIAGSGESGGDVHAVLRLESWLQARRTYLPIPQRKEVNTDEVLHA